MDICLRSASLRKLKVIIKYFIITFPNIYEHHERIFRMYRLTFLWFKKLTLSWGFPLRLYFLAAPICWEKMMRERMHSKIIEEEHRKDRLCTSHLKLPWIMRCVDPLSDLRINSLIKKKIKFSSHIRKFRMERLQSQKWGRAS